MSSEQAFNVVRTDRNGREDVPPECRPPGDETEARVLPGQPRQERREGIESRWGRMLFGLYGVSRRPIRRFIRYLAQRLEGGPLHSVTIRRIFARYHGIVVGMYTGRGCFCEGHFAPGTTIGRYTAIYRTVMAFETNHPMSLKSTHAFFYNPALGYAKTDLLTRTKLTIGNDVWIGHNAIILASVSSIGDGAIIGAGAVVHQDVPPYAVMVGNPARIVRYRFSPDLRAELLKSKWWEKPIVEILPEFASFQKPLETDAIR